MPSITGISHVDLSVTDLATGDAWYRELLGAVPLFDGRNDGSAWITWPSTSRRATSSTDGWPADGGSRGWGL